MMGIFDGILICSDLDGTLYKNDKTISAENKEAIEFFKSEGGSFTFITGRLPYYSLDAFKAVNPNVPYGCINGGGVYDGTAKRYIWTKELSLEAIELVRYIDESFSDVGIQLCCFDKTCFAKENDTTVRFRKTTGLPNITCDYRSFSEPLGKIIFCTDEEEKLLAIEKALLTHEKADNFSFIRSEHSLFEILPKGVNKGLAIEKLAEYLNIEHKKTIAIGDYDNDVSMLKAAGIGIAVKNASPRAKDAADFVTVSNEENAIAQIISDIENKRYTV
jgi:Cof subfamily protein (haloacid dehalogenase superfamily)